MDLRQLSYLVAVGDEGGIRAAARRLYCSQPQVSRALRELEREFGVELLTRSPHGVTFTPQGAELLAHGRTILAQVEEARRAMRPARERPVLRVGVVVGVISAGELLAPILAAFRSARPDVDLRVDDLGMCDQVTPVLDGTVDVAVVRFPIRHPELAVTAIACEPRILLTGAMTDLAQEERVHLDDVLGLPTLPLGSRPEWCAYWQLDAERGGSNCAVDVPPASTVSEAQLAVASREVVVSSSAALGRLAPYPLMASVPLDGVEPTTIAVAHRRGEGRRLVHQFVETAQRTAEEQIGLLPDGTLPA